MESCDVLIVGGGPAGASCAWALHRAGLDVAVLDQAQFPRDKVCAGWITPAVLTALKIDTEDFGRDRVLQPITGFRVGLMGRPSIDIRYRETVSYGIRRCEFDDYLLRRSGARLFTGTPVRSLRRDAGSWLVDDRFRTPMLVGAGGHTCPVARALGAHPGAEPAVAAQEVEFLLPEGARAACAVQGEQPELYFCKDLAGYGWCFRKGDYLNIGLGRDGRQGLAPQVEDFLAFLCRERGVARPPGSLARPCLPAVRPGETQSARRWSPAGGRCGGHGLSPERRGYPPGGGIRAARGMDDHRGKRRLWRNTAGALPHAACASASGAASSARRGHSCRVASHPRPGPIQPTQAAAPIRARSGLLTSEATSP